MNGIENRLILIVEDSPEDFEAMLRAFKKAGLRNPTAHCEDGDDALDYLYQRGAYANPEAARRPALILLDLNLPGTDGRQVLETIKSDPALRSIPVVVLTTSRDPVDIEKCYSFGANSYIQKPVNLAGFVTALERLSDYWFEIVILPREMESN
jgi:CheY-like chemotaxis protein